MGSLCPRTTSQTNSVCFVCTSGATHAPLPRQIWSVLYGICLRGYEEALRHMQKWVCECEEATGHMHIRICGCEEALGHMHIWICGCEEALGHMHIWTCGCGEAPGHMHIWICGCEEALGHMHICICGCREALGHMHIWSCVCGEASCQEPLPRQIGRDLFGEPVPTNNFPNKSGLFCMHIWSCPRPTSQTNLVRFVWDLPTWM